MSNDSENTVTSLSRAESWSRLPRQKVGRLVTTVGSVTDIFPVTYVVDGESIVFRTAEGSKLSEITVSDRVLFEVDEVTDDAAWSVIIRGRAKVLRTEAEIAHADELPLSPIVPTLKLNYVRITPDDADGAVSGRLFIRGEEPDRYGVVMY